MFNPVEVEYVGNSQSRPQPDHSLLSLTPSSVGTSVHFANPAHLGRVLGLVTSLTGLRADWQPSQCFLAVCYHCVGMTPIYILT